MTKKVTRQELESLLVDLRLVSGIHWYSHGITPTPYKSDKWYQNVGGKCLDEVVERLDNDDNDIDDKINLLLDHLGLEVVDGKRIVKKKAVKK